MAFVGNLVTRSGRRLRLLLTGLALIFAVGALPTLALAAPPFRPAAATAPPLGTAQSFAVLGASTVTNTGPTVVTGDLGLSAGSAVIGFPPGIVIGGTIHAADAIALQAKNDVTTAYINLAGQPCTGNLTGKDLGGLTLIPGVYCFSSTAQLTGALTLDAQGSASAVFIFQVGTTLTTASNSSVRVINGGTNCNVFWQVGTSATLGVGTRFVGSILALTSITLATGANVSGRALARNGTVTLDTNTVSSGGCGTAAATATATLSPATQTAVAGATQTAVAARPPAPCVGNIRGSKQDGAGNGLAGWTIQLIQNGQVVQTAVTDSAGNFNFLGLNKGTYTIQEVQQNGWTARAPTSIDVTLSACDQNLTGYTFVNVSGTGALTPVATLSSATQTAVIGATQTASALTSTAVAAHPSATALPATLTAIARGTTGTPAGGSAGLTPTAVGTPAIPSGLPSTGESSPWTGAFALILGALLLAAGFVTLRARV